MQDRMEKLRESAQCVVCFEVTTETAKRAERRLFNCGHSVCRQCLDIMISSAILRVQPRGGKWDYVSRPTYVSCPIRREQMWLVREKAEAFQRNDDLEKTAQAIEARTVDKTLLYNC